MSDAGVDANEQPSTPRPTATLTGRGGIVPTPYYLPNGSHPAPQCATFAVPPTSPSPATGPRQRWTSSSYSGT